MADEEEIELVDEPVVEKTPPIDKRINNALKARDEALKAKEELESARQKAEEERQAALKELEFFKGFSQVTSKYSGAGEYQEQIKEKVMAGYDMEDAAIAVLARENKLSQGSVRERENPAGGSASNSMRSGGEKSPTEMSQSERLQALEQIERESGDLTNLLRPTRS